MARNGAPPLSTAMARAGFRGALTTSQYPTRRAARQARRTSSSKATKPLKTHRERRVLGAGSLSGITPLYVRAGGTRGRPLAGAVDCFQDQVGERLDELGRVVQGGHNLELPDAQLAGERPGRDVDLTQRLDVVGDESDGDDQDLFGALLGKLAERRLE